MERWENRKDGKVFGTRGKRRTDKCTVYERKKK